MLRRRSGVVQFAVLASCAALLAGCAGGGAAHGLAPNPSAPHPSSVAITPAAPPPVAGTKTASSPDVLGARRVIPVPKSLAEQQIHRLMAVDNQAVLLDAGPGARQRPLLVVLHGLGEDAGEMRRQTGFTALAALTGFDVVYPNAPQDPPASAGDSSAIFTRATVAISTAPAPAASEGPAASTTQTPTASPTSAAPTATPIPSPTASPTRSIPSSPRPSPSHTPSPSPAPTVTTAPKVTTPPPVPKTTKHATPTPTKSASHPRPPKKKRPSPLVPGTRAWNAGTCCAVSTRDDVSYLVDVVHAVAASVPVDIKRVYVVGFSNGGMMALDAICSAPTVFAAAGSVSGPFLGSRCARPIWRHIAAAPDEVVPPAGGVSPGIPSLGVSKDWCGCNFPATTTENARFGPYVSVLISPTGGHGWPTPDSTSWPFDPERDLWNYVSRFQNLAAGRT